MSWDCAAQSISEQSPLFRSMYGNEGEAEIVHEKDWKMNTGLQVVKGATVRNWQHNDNACERLSSLAVPNPSVLSLTMQ